MSCEKPPKFDFKPVIELNDLYHSKYFNAENEFFIDTFNVSIKFKDGDGDLGVEK